MTFWAGVFLGFIASVLANHYWDFRARYLAYKAANRLVGTWVAYNMHGRTVDATPMAGAGLTKVFSKPHWWSANSAVLDVRAEDIDASTGHTRAHEGHIVIDPSFPWLETRIDRYADSNEISEQRLVIGSDFNIVHVFPIATIASLGDVYQKHAWRRQD